MNNTKKLIVIILAFVLLIGGASVLYNRLSQEGAPDQLVTLPTQPTSPPTQPSEPSTQPTEPSASPTDPAVPPTDPTEPSTAPTEPPTDPTEPSTAPTEPPTDPTEPSTAPTEPPTEPTEPSKPTGSAPDFVIYDADGNQVRLSDFFGKPIVLNFWASWCGPCQMEMPHFQEVYEELGDEVVFLMVNVTGEGNDSKSAAQAFIQNNNYTFPVLFDMDLDATYAYGVNGFPMTFFINANGDPMLYAPGAITEATLRDAIERIR